MDKFENGWNNGCFTDVLKREVYGSENTGVWFFVDFSRGLLFVPFGETFKEIRKRWGKLSFLLRWLGKLLVLYDCKDKDNSFSNRKSILCYYLFPRIFFQTFLLLFITTLLSLMFTKQQINIFYWHFLSHLKYQVQWKIIILLISHLIQKRVYQLRNILFFNLL